MEKIPWASNDQGKVYTSETEFPCGELRKIMNWKGKNLSQEYEREKFN